MTGDECAAAVKSLLEAKDDPPQILPVQKKSCPTIQCRGLCSIRVCPDVCPPPSPSPSLTWAPPTPGSNANVQNADAEMTVENKDVLLDVRDILNTCAGDGTTPFHGEVKAGEGDTARTVKLVRVGEGECAP